MTGEIPIICPQCRHRGSVPASFLGKRIHCRTCAASFLVEAAGEPDPAEVSALATARALAAAPAEMAIRAEPPDDPDDIPLVPMSPEEELHCRERYEARVLSKDLHGAASDPEIEREREHQRRLEAMKEAGLTSPDGRSR